MQSTNGAASSDVQACLTRSEDLSELNPSMHVADIIDEHPTPTKSVIDFAVPRVTHNENETQADHSIAAQVHEDYSTGRGLETSTFEQTYRDALMGTLDRKGKKPVSSVDPTTGIEIIEHSAALHAHPPPNIFEERPKANEDAMAEPCDPCVGVAPTTSSGQDEERSTTESPTYAQSLRLSHSVRKGKAPMREKLSPIKEASNWADLVEASFPENNLSVRCSNRVIYFIKFDNADEKDRFRRVLATCLFMTIEVTELVDYLFRLIRDKLRSQVTPPDLETALKYQFHEEFCVTIQQHITGERHACVTDWDGRNRRNCSDPVCRAEYRRLLGSLGGKGHCQLIDHLEGTYWILRAARTTHPSVTDANARMQGEGFNYVADEDRREFRRGAGWDGAGTGDMEIEGIND
ncbi:hypothetical protein BBP40_012332 [Aspergillus hancockii]|nr:hypothetical protein BBP40_012332 [Aspergillus hancockii]